jgi:hypothetical protein
MTEELVPHTNLRRLVPKWRKGRVERVRLGWRHVRPGMYFEEDGILYRIDAIAGRELQCRCVFHTRRRLSDRLLATQSPVTVLHHERGAVR